MWFPFSPNFLVPTCDLLLSLGTWIYVLSFIVEGEFCFLRHLLSIVVLQMTLKSSSLKQRVVILPVSVGQEFE